MGSSLLTVEVQVAEAEHRKHGPLTLKVANVRKGWEKILLLFFGFFLEGGFFFSGVPPT